MVGCRADARFGQCAKIRRDVDVANLADRAVGNFRETGDKAQVFVTKKQCAVRRQLILLQKPGEIADSHRGRNNTGKTTIRIIEAPGKIDDVLFCDSSQPGLAKTHRIVSVRLMVDEVVAISPGDGIVLVNTSAKNNYP